MDHEVVEKGINLYITKIYVNVKVKEREENKEKKWYVSLHTADTRAPR